MQVTMSGKGEHKVWTIWIHNRNLFDHFVILSRSEERGDSDACLSEGWEKAWQRVESSVKR